MSDIYDDESFFNAYSEMARSKDGLKAAGEWHQLKKLFPDFTGKRVLDLGCGYGWHCRYAADHGAREIVGIDASTKMIDRAKAMTESPKVSYQVLDMMDIGQLSGTFDVIISSLAIHYIEDYAGLVQLIKSKLNSGGRLIISVEHPIFTAQGNEEWVLDSEGHRKYWPVDRYFDESSRETDFLGHSVKKYHRTLMTYLNTLLNADFRLNQVIEPTPTDKMLAESSDMRDELRRPMMLIISATLD